MTTKKEQGTYLWKYSGILLVITGIIHTLVGIWLGREAYIEMIRDGFVNSVADDYVREFAFWFLVCGVLLIFFGQTLHYYIRKEQQPAPLFLGYCILVFSLIGCVIEPISGFWLFIPQAIIILVAHRKKRLS